MRVVECRYGRLGLFLIAGLAAAVSAPSLRAEKIIAYEVRISESPLVLDHPDSAGMARIAGARTTSTMARLRSQPYIDITNHSADDAQLTHFRMTIGDVAFNFNSINIVAAGDVGVTTQIVAGGDAIEISFSNFDPGKTVRLQFQIKPDSAAAFQYPDYRTVLFDLNGRNGSQSSSAFQATFTDPVAGDNETLYGELPNFHISGRPMISPHFCGGSHIVHSFSYGNNGSLTGTNGEEPPPPPPPPPPFVIPEPGSLALLVLGSVACCASKLLRRPARRRRP